MQTDSRGRKRHRRGTQLWWHTDGIVVPVTVWSDSGTEVEVLLGQTVWWVPPHQLYPM